VPGKTAVKAPDQRPRPKLRALGISPRTVEFHRANVMQKLGARNTADLVRRLLDEPPDAARRSG
jgi:hypothetical protein